MRYVLRMRVWTGASVALIVLIGGCTRDCPRPATAAGPATPSQLSVPDDEAIVPSLVLSDDGSGAVELNGEPVQAGGVEAAVGARLAEEPQLRLVLQLPADYTHANTIEWIKRLRAMGAREVVLSEHLAPDQQTPSIQAAQTPSAAPAGDTPAPPDPAPPSPPSPPPVEVALKVVGLHVGGGPNDDTTKRIFRDPVEAGFDAFRACFAKKTDPKSGGVLGVDLYVPAGGGSGKVRQVRTGMKGQAFRDCSVSTFESATFGKPPKGAAVVSISIRFTPK